jgi:hypothetical protein
MPAIIKHTKKHGVTTNKQHQTKNVFASSIESQTLNVYSDYSPHEIRVSSQYTHTPKFSQDKNAFRSAYLQYSCRELSATCRFLGSIERGPDLGRGTLEVYNKISGRPLVLGSWRF